MIHSKSLKRALAFLMVIVIMFVTIFTDNVVKRVLVRAGDNVEAGSGSDGEDTNPSANPSAAPSAKPDEGTGEDETQYPVLGEDINNSGTYNKYSNGEIKILLDLDKLTDDDTKAAIENAGEITSVKYSINLEERNAVKKDENDNKKWIITIPEYEEENSSGNVTYVINQIKVNDTIELNEFSAYSLNVTRNTVAPKIKLSYGVKELNDGDSILNNDDIALNIKAIDENGDELKSTDEDGNESNAYDVQWKLLKDNGEDIQMKPAIAKDTENGGFNTVLSKEDGKTHKFELTLNVTDVWGNSSEISATAVIDNVTPEMNINEKSSDNSGKRVFEVTVSDDQNLYSDFENEKDDLNKLVSVLDDSKNEVTDAEISAEESSENNVVKYKVSFSNNENTTYSIKVKDLAGNDKSSQLDTFELKDLTGLSDAETTYIGKDGKDVSFTLKGKIENVESVNWGYDINTLEKIDPKEGTYSFKINIENLKEGEKTIYVVVNGKNIRFTKAFKIYIDKTGPSIEFKKYTEVNGWMRSDELKILIEDKNGCGVINDISIYKISGEDNNQELTNEDKITGYDVEDNDNIKCISINNIKDSKGFRIVVVAKDELGNSNTGDIYIQKDTSKPEGKIILSDLQTEWDKFTEPEFGEIYRKDAQTFTVNGSDDTSGIAEAKYYVTNKVANAIKSVEDLEKLKETAWKNLTKTGEGTYKTDSISAISSSVVYVKLKDKAGNIKYICSDGVVIDDKMTIEAPTKISWTNKPEIKVKMNASISGFDSYKVTRRIGEEDEVILESNTNDIDGINNKFGLDEEKITTLTINEDTPGIIEGDYSLIVWAKNKAGVESEHTIQIQYDCTEPEVEDINLNNFVKNGEWIRSNDASMNFKVKDKSINNIEVSKLRYVKVYKVAEDFDISQKLDGIEPIINYDNLSENEKEIELNSLDDGSYKIIVDICDRAGNNKVQEIADIRKDTIIPKGKIILSDLQTEWDKFTEPEFGEIYRKDAQTFTVNGSDDTSGIAEAKYYVTNKVANAIKSVEDLEKLKETAWKNLTKTGEGTYKTDSISAISSSVVYVKLKDKAGNIKYICSDGVVIDDKMTIEAPTKISWTNKPEIKVKMNASISGFDSYKVTRRIGEEDEVILESNTNDIDGINNKFGLDEEKITTLTINEDTPGIIEGDYSLIVWAKNKAGVVSEHTIQIQYDKTPVTIKIGNDEFDTYVKDNNGWVNSKDTKLPIYISDKNENGEPSGVNTVFCYEIVEDKFSQYNTYIEQNSIKDLVKSLTDDKVSPKQIKQFDTKCDYPLTSDGKYYILVVATDKAGNMRANYKLIQRDTSISKPNCEIKGFKEGDWINCSNKGKAKLDVAVEDEISKIQTVSVYTYKYNKKPTEDNSNEWRKKDNKKDKYTESKLDADGKMTIELGDDDFKDGEYYVIVEATDKAGNTNFIPKKIKKDTKETAIKLEVTNKGWINATNGKDAKISVTITDVAGKGVNKTSGINKVSVYTYDKKPTKDNTNEWHKNKNTKYSKSKLDADGKMTIELGSEDFVDGEYYLVVEATDTAGNTNFAYQQIKKDTKETAIKLEATNKGWINATNGKDAKINVTITDVAGKGVNKTSGINKVSVYTYDKKPTKANSNEWKKNVKYSKSKVDTTNYKMTIELGNKDFVDGEYYVIVEATDKAGNTTTNPKYIKIRKDTKSPNGYIYLSSTTNDWNLGWKSEPLFEKFSNKDEDFILKYDDDLEGINKTSGIASVYYRITEEELHGIDYATIKNSTEWTKVDEEEVKNGILEIPIGNNKNVNAVIYVKIVDNAGNINLMRSNGITIDHYAPEAMAAGNDEPIISIDVASSDIGQDGIYKSAPVINYDIQDKEYNNVYSGLQEIIYTVTNEDTGVTTGKTTVDGVNDGVTRNPEYRGSINLSSLGETVYNGNNITVQITAKDNAENEYKPSSKSLSIDTTKPTVNVTYKDSTGAEVEPNGRFFNNDITMVVTVTERNFDADDTLFRINGQQISLNGMTLVGDAPAGGNGDGDTHTYEYRFTGDEANDKDYTVEYVSCTDKAGNASDSVITPQTFTVDKVQPTVSANDAAGYSSSALTYTATVVERNFDEAGAKVLVTKRLNGSLSYENREYPVIWSTSGDTHTAALSFAEDGDYSFTITCTDKAGNQQAAVYTSKEFTVDNVDPVLTSNISEENNNIANKGNIDFEYVYTDINSSNESGMIGYKVRTLAGTAVNDWVPEIKNVNVDGVNGYTIKFHDNATATKLKDGIYTIELTVKDKAGREAKDEKQFSVNRHGSAYSYISSSYTGAVILQQYVKEITDDIEVVVMNCDDITQYQVEVWNSLNEQNILKPDEDYTWKKENSGYVYKEDNSNRESGFTMYSCKIKPEVFSNEGTYTVRVSTKDIADDAAYGDNAALLYNDDTNTDNNMDITTNMDTAQADKIEFTVDRTNPEIVIMDIDNNGKYNLDKKFSFDYADANELDDIKIVRKDGDKVLETITYKPSDLKDLKTGNISAVAKEYDGYQTITISATDKAGNTGSASVKVLVTSNIWVKYINNTPLVVATIIVAVVAAGGIVFIFYRRRKRGEQSQS